jgi:hypothetical protein
MVDSARLFAMMNLSAADAAINTWNVQGRILGRKVAHYMAKHYFQPLRSP